MFLSNEEIKQGLVAEIEGIYKGAFAVFVVLRALQNERKIVKATLRTIARLSGMAPETIRKILRELEDNDCLMRLTKKRGDAQEYVLHI